MYTYGDAGMQLMALLLTGLYGDFIWMFFETSHLIYTLATPREGKMGSFAETKIGFVDDLEFAFKVFSNILLETTETTCE